jgi:hypothetical protein
MIGINGKTHGDRIDRTPAKKAKRKDPKPKSIK